MKPTRCLHCILILCGMLLAPTYGYGQTTPEEHRDSTPPLTEPQHAQIPKLSPGAEEVAKDIGVLPLIERYYSLPENDRGQDSRPMSLEALSLREEITETVVGASLEVDGVAAEIDNEIAQTNEVRAYLESRRDRTLTINNIANFVSSGVLGIFGSAIQLRSDGNTPGNIIGIVAGGVSTVLSTIGLRQQHGGKRTLGVTPNLLAKFFDRPVEFHSDYPQDIWTYLSAVPPTEPQSGTRREQLVKRWLDNGHLDDPTTQKGKRKIEFLTSSISKQQKLTIDLLQDRAAMLADVRARVLLMKRDLSKLMLALRPHH